MKHLRAVNKKARRIDQMISSRNDVVALQQQQPRPHVPMGCTLSFSPGWEVDSAGGTAGLCQHLGDSSGQGGLAMIDVADRANVHMRLIPLKFRFGHLSAPCGLKT